MEENEVAEAVETQQDEVIEPEKTPEEIEKEEYGKRVQKRIAKETWEKNELKRRIEALETELSNAKTPQIKKLDNGAPDPEQFPAGRFDPDYQEHLADFKSQQAVDNYKKSVSNAQKEQALLKMAESVQQKYDDYDDAIEEF